jgi:hypothetical protein
MPVRLKNYIRVNNVVMVKRGYTFWKAIIEQIDQNKIRVVGQYAASKTFWDFDVPIKKVDDWIREIEDSDEETSSFFSSPSSSSSSSSSPKKRKREEEEEEEEEGEEEEEQEAGPKRKRKKDGSKEERKYKGVTKNRKRFQAQIKIDGKLQSFGTFDTHPRRLLKRTIVPPSKQNVQDLI